MAGVKGRSGGARPNTGGARPGSGPKPKPKPPVIPAVEPIKVPTAAEVAAAAAGTELPKAEDLNTSDTLKLLQDIAFGRIEVNPIQLRAAIAAVQYTHTKTHDGGKKEMQQKEAEEISGKFARNKAPKLVANGGSLVRDDGEE